MKICYVAISKSLSEGYFGRDLWIVCKGFVAPPSRNVGKILPLFGLAKSRKPRNLVPRYLGVKIMK